MIYIIVILVIALVLFFVYNKSTFIDQMSSTFTCDEKPYPQGNVPGSYLGLTPSERSGLLKRFINNNPNLT